MVRINFRTQQRYAKVMIGVFIILFILMAWYYTRLTKEITSLSEQAADSMQKVAQANSEVWWKKIAQREQELTELTSEFSFLDDPIILLVTLGNLVDMTGVEVTYFKQEESLSASESKMPSDLEMVVSFLSLSLRGEWPSINAFVQQLDLLSTFLIIEELTIANEGKEARGTMKIVIFQPKKSQVAN